MFGGRLALLLSWIVIGALLLFTHGILLWSALSTTRLGPRRWVALIPPFTPFAAWFAGARVGPVLWAALLGLYILLRTIG